MKTYNKKGEFGINQLAGIITMLIVISVMLVVALILDDDLQTSVATATHTLPFVNETTLSYVSDGNTTTPTTYNAGMRGCSLSLTYVTNATGDSSLTSIINSGNYTVTNCTIQFSSDDATDSSKYNDSKWNLTGSITYLSDDDVYNATRDIKGSKTNISAQTGLLGTIIIFGVVISVVTIAFMFR